MHQRKQLPLFSAGGCATSSLRKPLNATIDAPVEVLFASQWLEGRSARRVNAEPRNGSGIFLEGSQILLSSRS